jgi:5'(3')-deoxyribonucleotidase
MEEMAFLDMDGVLADFNKAAHVAHGKPRQTSRSFQQPWDLHLLWGQTEEEFWAPTNSFEFWYNIEKTPEADEIVELAMKTWGVGNIAILTSPSDFGECIHAKREWIKRYYPQFEKRMIYAYSKKFLASPWRVLLDDRERNVDDFNAAGGFAIMVPRLWNSRYAESDRVMEVLRREV